MTYVIVLSVDGEPRRAFGPCQYHAGAVTRSRNMQTVLESYSVDHPDAVARLSVDVRPADKVTIPVLLPYLGRFNTAVRLSIATMEA